MVVKHAFRNACIPVITVLGLQFGQLLGGAIITETVFAWPGVATLTVDSIRNQDFPVVQCAVVLLALLIVAVNLDRGRPGRLHRPARPGGRMSAVGAPSGDGASRPTRRGADARVAPGIRWRRLLAAQVGRWARRIVLLVIVLSAVLAPVDLAPRPAGGGHPAPAGAARLDGGRHAGAPPRHRPGRAATSSRA